MLCGIFSIANYIFFLIKHISSWRKKSLPCEAYNLDMTSEKSCLTLCDPMDCTSMELPVHGILQNTGVGSLSFLRRIFPTHGLSPGLPRCRWILYQLSCKGSPRILERVAYLFSRETSWPRNQTGVSYIAGGFFANRAMREAHKNKG